MAANTEAPAVQDLLRLTPKQTAEIVRAMDQREEGRAPRQRRDGPRLRYHPAARLPVLLENERKGRRTYALAPRNLSAGGVALLHGKFVYAGTNCVVGLRSRDGQVVPVHGRVVWCRLVTGRVHEIGVRFDEPIELGEFAE